jgi:glycosyltransferase involved in cell wall biosynthesis
MLNPLVSIIIPTYNYAHLITYTLQSVVEQSYDHWECIIIDDGSTDNTSEVVSAFLLANPGYQISYYQCSNQGTSFDKNKGIDLSKGKLIHFLDADDLLSPEKLTIQVAILARNDEAALVFSHSKFFGIISGKQLFSDKYPEGFLALESLGGSELLRRLIQNNIITISSPLVKKDLVLRAGKFDITLHNNEDWIFWFKVAVLQSLFLFDDDHQSFVMIRMHGNSAMNQHRKMFLGEVTVRERIKVLLTQSTAIPQTGSLKKLNLDLLALHHIRSLDLGKGFYYIITKFMSNPMQNYSLVGRGCFKLFVRLYKTMVKREN